jgi:hypothetical protein
VTHGHSQHRRVLVRMCVCNMIVCVFMDPFAMLKPSWCNMHAGLLRTLPHMDFLRAGVEQAAAH